MNANDFTRQPTLEPSRAKCLSFLAAVLLALYSNNLFASPALAQTVKSDPAKAVPAKPVAGATKTQPPAASDPAARHIVKARSLAGAGRFDDASAELRAELEANPKNVEALYFLGYVLGRQGKFEESISREKNALEIDPNNAAAYAVLGLSLGSMRQYSEAAKALQQSLQLQPLAPSSYVNLAAIREKQGDCNAACALYQHAIAIDPQYTRAYLGLAEARAKLGDKPGVVEACRMAVKYAPKSALAHAKLGMALSEAGDLGASVAEGFTANWLKLQESWNDFLGTFLAAWGLVFLGFSLIFAVVFAGSSFKPQEGEKVLRSFFLTFYKDQPGRFVVTDSRLVFVPEIFSSVFGATRVSIQRAQIESIQYLSTMGGGTVSILTRDKSVHQFRMPILVLDPLRSLLVGQALAAGFGPAAEVPANDAASIPAAASTGTEEPPTDRVSLGEDAIGADLEPEKEPPAPQVEGAPKTIAPELEITEVDSATTLAKETKAEDNKT
jgi:tetratricopeptide (TPR) repeat protein